MKGKYILVSEDGKDFYKDKDDKLILLDDLSYACNMMGMLEVDGYVCEIKHHHIESELSGNDKNI